MIALHKNKTILIISCLLVSISIAACSKSPKQNQVYVVKEEGEKKDVSKIAGRLNTEGISAFYSFEGLNVKENREQIPLTLSADKKYVYYMKPSIAKVPKEAFTVIKGDATSRVDIMKVDMETGDVKNIVSYVPFVSSVKWNKEKNMVAFLGGNTLTVYNDKENTLIESFQADGDGISSFGWSPDGKKIYTEGQSLINNGIYYVDSKKFVWSYEIKENLYFKGTLDEQYYYGTERTGDNSYNTSIVDKDGKVVSGVTSSGRFRDSYKKAFIQIGKNNFELNYYPDINDLDNAKLLSKDYISDAKFIFNGGLVYITPNDNPEENNYYLHVVNEKGEEIKKLQVSGSSIFILADGKTGYVGGSNIERVDLINNSVEGPSMEAGNNERESILRTIRGAMDVIYKYEMTQEKDINRVNKYFIDSHNPEQWAYTDVMNIYNENSRIALKAEDYTVVLKLKSLGVNKNAATADINILARNSSGTGMSTNSVIELIKKDNNWYVAGLSTFPNSKQYMELKTKVEAVVKQAQEGKLFNGMLKDKEIQIGQIQFWQLSEPHLADNIDNANYCKIYLKVKEENKEVLYKLIFDRKKQNYWKESTLSKENLSKLF